MACPQSKLPIDVFIQSVPKRHHPVSLEFTLQAIVKCKAMGSVKFDVIPFVQKFVFFQRLPLAGDESTGENVNEEDDLVDGRETTVPFHKEVELIVPDADKLGVLGCGFKAPLIELSHQVVFVLHTLRKRKGGFGYKKASFNLGHVSVELMR
ncbi:hypothetical protein BDR26DRAFT_939807 [Obelidium mucronatum]|nr:hypothetical protein BDR26DRAFT_939807 [Obelidium mucronatum]